MSAFELTGTGATGATGAGGAQGATGATGTAGATGAGANWVLLEDQLLVGTTASFDFQSISGSYKHLKVVYQARSNDAGVAVIGVEIRFNNDSTGIYGSHFVAVTNATAGAGSNANGSDTSADACLATGATAPSGRAGSGEILIPNYAETTFQKEFEAISGALGSDAIGANWISRKHHGIWRSTAAITRITLFPSPGGSWVAGSRATLYGMS